MKESLWLTAWDHAFEALQQIPNIFAQPGGNFYWPYLVSNFMLAWGVVFWVTKTSIKDALLRTLMQIFPINRSTLHDFALFIGNILLIAVVFDAALLSADTVASIIFDWLDAQITRPTLPIPEQLQIIITTVVAFLAADLGFYCSHRAQHKFPWLWEFHKIHHCATSLNPFTVFRRHPIDYIIDHLVMGSLLGLALALCNFIFNNSNQINIWQQNLGYFLFALLGAHLQHSHVQISWGRLDQILVSPAIHQLHHSTAHEHLDRNFGNVLSLWDTLFGSLARPSPQKKSIQFGLYVAEDQARYSSIFKLYCLPVRDLLRLIRQSL